MKIIDRQTVSLYTLEWHVFRLEGHVFSCDEASARLSGWMVKRTELINFQPPTEQVFGPFPTRSAARGFRYVWQMIDLCTESARLDDNLRSSLRREDKKRVFENLNEERKGSAITS